MLPLSSSASAPPPASSSSRTPYWTARANTPLEKKMFLHQSIRGACGRTADIQHWAQTHALGEVKAMLDGHLVRDPSSKRQPLSWWRFQHLPFCRLCRQTSTTRRELEQHVTTCFPGQPPGCLKGHRRTQKEWSSHG